MLEVMHYTLHNLLRLIQPLLVPICFGFAWLLVGLMSWSIWTAIRDAVSTAKQMHEIPCANCQFFTNTHYLKCPVHPKIALSNEAINCPDYQPSGYASLLEDEASWR